MAKQVIIYGIKNLCWSCVNILTLGFFVCFLLILSEVFYPTVPASNETIYFVKNTIVRVMPPMSKHEIMLSSVFIYLLICLMIVCTMIVNMLRLPSKLFISEYNFDIVKYRANGVQDFYVLQHYFVKYGILSKEKYTPERLYHYLYALGLGIGGSSGIAKLADIVDEKLDNSYDSHVRFINASNFEKYFGMSMEQINIFMNEIVMHEMNTETSR